MIKNAAADTTTSPAASLSLSKTYLLYLFHLGWSLAILTSDDFIRSNEIIKTKWPIYEVIGHFVISF